jgi:predicted DNA binding protein
MFQARLKIELLNDWAKFVIEKFNCELNSLFCANIDKNHVLDIVVFSKILEYKNLVKFLQNEKTISEFEVLSYEKNYFVCKIITKYETIIYSVLKHNCFMLGNIKIKGNFEYWNIGSSNKENIKKLIEEFRKIRKVEILEIRKYDFEKRNLTKKQYSLIKFVLKEGYFEIPKKISLDSLCDELKISKSTLAVHIQKAEKKIIKSFLENTNEYVRQ